MINKTELGKKTLVNISGQNHVYFEIKRLGVEIRKPFRIQEYEDTETVELTESIGDVGTSEITVKEHRK